MRATRRGSLLSQSAERIGRYALRSPRTARTTFPPRISTTGMTSMGSRMRVFVYEYLSGGACARITASDEALMLQGRAMRDALVYDLATIGGVATTYATIGPPASAPGARAVRAKPG